MNLLLLQQSIADELDTAVNEIFIRHQNELGITDGGITPNESVWLDETIDGMTEAIAMMISNQFDRMKYATANLSIEQLAERIASIEMKRNGTTYNHDFNERIQYIIDGLLYETSDIIEWLENCTDDIKFDGDEINALLCAITSKQFETKKAEYIKANH